jgi:hypothetical protein
LLSISAYTDKRSAWNQFQAEERLKFRWEAIEVLQVLVRRTTVSRCFDGVTEMKERRPSLSEISAHWGDYGFFFLPPSKPVN